MSEAALSGSCLCGAVRFSAVPEKPAMDACHCAMCRRWGSGPVMTVTCARLEIADKRALGVYSSSEWAERCFCKECGASLFWRMKDGGFIAVNAHAFDEPVSYPFTVEIYVDQKPATYAFADVPKQMTGAEVEAMFAAKGEGEGGA